MGKSKRAALYLRVSTNGQTTANQRQELERVAEQRGWTVVGVYEDHGVSGAKGRDKRPAFDRLHKDAARGKFDLVMAWSIDRLGRSLLHVVSFLAELGELSVGLYLHQQAVDSSTPAGKAMLAMCGVFAEFEREMIRERINAGLARARKQGIKLGRPRITDDVTKRIRTLAKRGLPQTEIAQQTGVGRATVQRALEAAAQVS